jgi:predicted Rossmann fold flavoprotein
VNPAGTWDVAVIGAGAAGLAAGIFAAEASPRARVAVFDGAARIGAKILVAGGGRCNVTHFRVTPDDYNAASRGFVKNVLAAFTVEQTVEWFASMGVALKREETGKLFPTTDKARTILDALMARLHERGATLLAGHRVTAVDAPGATDNADRTRFVIQTARETHAARRVILCTGGRSLPRTGSDGGGYELARSLGHTVTHTHAALVPMVLQQHFFHAALSGVSHEAQITTLAGGKPVDRRRGSLLWTHFGVSGPLAMDASRHWLAARDAGLAPAWQVSLFPEARFETLEAEFVARAADSPRLPVRRVLDQRAGLPEKLLVALLAWCGIDGATSLAQLRRDDRRKLIHALLELPLPVEQDRGWNYAEVTAGGVPLAEVSWRAMSSRLCPGLHLAGEILDVDGRIGGLNFQWAWSTGHLAGRAAATGLGEAAAE